MDERMTMLAYAAVVVMLSLGLGGVTIWMLGGR